MALIAYILVKLSAKTILKPLDLRSLYLKRPSLKTHLVTMLWANGIHGTDYQAHKIVSLYLLSFIKI